MHRFKLFFLLICCLSCRVDLSAQEVNFSEHVAPIIYENCTRCHRAGEVAPIPFTNYQEVADFGTTIQYVTQINYMPPWPPNRDYSHFVGERSLTDEEIQTISDWVSGGMPQGDSTLEPALPVFATGSQIGTPDLVLEMEESYTVAGNNQDDYRVFVIPTNFSENREIAAMEFRPDNSRAVHHVLFGYDLSGAAAARDAQSPEVYGYSSFGDFGINQAVYLSWTYVPGSQPLVFPEGLGQTIPAGADLLIQVHYAPLPTAETDQSSINVFFKSAADEIEREVQQAMTLPGDLPGSWGDFYLPPGTTRTFTALGADGNGTSTIPVDISLISVGPHAHYLGRSYEVYAVTPAGDTLNIIQIEEWDFNWQGTYTLERMLKIPAGSRLYTVAEYDNTANNPNNPANPPVGVGWGEGTNDEMLVVFFYYVSYQDGDEDIVLGNMPVSVTDRASPTGSLLHPPTPNPLSDAVNLNFELLRAEHLSFDLFNQAGQRLAVLAATREWESGTQSVRFDLSRFATGTYFIRMNGAGYGTTAKIVIAR